LFGENKNNEKIKRHHFFTIARKVHVRRVADILWTNVPPFSGIYAKRSQLRKKKPIALEQYRAHMFYLLSHLLGLFFSLLSLSQNEYFLKAWINYFEDDFDWS
jgi:hypothetical protein